MTMIATNTSTIRLPEDAAAALRAAVSGEVVTPDSAVYDGLRPLHNFVFDQNQPAALVRATSTEDVAAAVRVARTHGLPIAVRGGGHSMAGHSSPDGAVVIDLRGMKAVSIDPVSRTARVGAGATSADLAVPASAFGLALSTGDTSTVGLGGLVTGGGIGWMVRKQGLTIDNLLSATVVSADGEVLRASAESHSDLFWAIRGGGGNFGIVTEFELRLHQVGMIQAGLIMLPATREALRGYLDYTPTATDDLTTIAFLTHAPPEPFVPQEAVGLPVLMVAVCYTGDPTGLDAALAPLRALGTPIVDMADTMPYPAIFAFTELAANRHGAAIRSMFTDDLDDDALDAIIAANEASTSPVSMVQFRGLGGAMSRVPAGATAFPHRDRRYLVAVIGIWLDPAEDPRPHQQWTEAVWDRISDAATGVYVNFLETEGDARIRDAYRGETLARLADVKRAYDPANVFQFNQNIRPS